MPGKDYHDKLLEINELMENEKYERAMVLINKHLEAEPEDAQVLLLKGRIFKQQQQLTDAINVLQKVLKIEPDNREAQSLKKMIQDILRFEQLDIYSSTNLSNDPWLDD